MYDGLLSYNHSLESFEKSFTIENTRKYFTIGI